MEQLSESEVFDIPGVGELPARKGTSTYELAGAVKVWHDKYQKAHKSGVIDGAVGGIALILLVELLGFATYYFLWS